MRFDINNYKDVKYHMICKNKEERNFFLTYLHDIGMTWHDGRSYTDENQIRIIDELLNNFCTSFYFNEGRWCPVDFGEWYYKTDGNLEYTLIFSDFDWGDDSYDDNEVSDEELLNFIQNNI